MFKLFYMGGTLFMSILSVLFLLVIITAVYTATGITNRKVVSSESFKMRASYIRGIGLFAMITGILGQLIGFYQGFSAIERAGDIVSIPKNPTS